MRDALRKDSKIPIGAPEFRQQASLRSPNQGSAHRPRVSGTQGLKVVADLSVTMLDLQVLHSDKVNVVEGKPISWNAA